MSSRRVGTAALLLMVMAAGSGCRVAYVPGDGPVAAPAGDPAALRRAVSVQPLGCTARAARAAVANRSAKALEVTVDVQWATPAGGAVGGEAKVTVPAGQQREVAVRAPAGAVADVGCQASAATVRVAP